MKTLLRRASETLGVTTISRYQRKKSEDIFDYQVWTSLIIKQYLVASGQKARIHTKLTSIAAPVSRGKRGKSDSGTQHCSDELLMGVIRLSSRPCLPALSPVSKGEKWPVSTSPTSTGTPTVWEHLQEWSCWLFQIQIMDYFPQSPRAETVKKPEM